MATALVERAQKWVLNSKMHFKSQVLWEHSQVIQSELFLSLSATVWVIVRVTGSNACEAHFIMASAGGTPCIGRLIEMAALPRWAMDLQYSRAPSHPRFQVSTWIQLKHWVQCSIVFSLCPPFPFSSSFPHPPFLSPFLPLPSFS